MPIDFGNEGYVLTPEEGDGAGREVVKGLWKGLNAAPDARLVLLNKQRRPEHPLVTLFKAENEAQYEQQPDDDSPSVGNRLVRVMQNMSVAPGMEEIQGGDGSLGRLFETLNMAPGVTQGQVDAEEMARVRRETGLSYKQRVIVDKADKKFLVGEAKRLGRAKAQAERAVQKGYEQGLGDNARADWVEAKMLEARNVVAAKAVDTAEEAVFQARKLFGFVRRVVFKKGLRTVDASFTKDK